MENVIDCKGLKCPQPVINTKKYFDSISEGDAVVIADNEIAKNNILKFAKNNGFLYSVAEKDDLYYISIKKSINKEAPAAQKSDSKTEQFTLIISSNMLGVGDAELGIALMKSYIYALSESDKIPQDLIFLNSGIFLTVEGSSCLDSLKKLKERGVTITTCGTCLDFYNQKEKLLIGDVTNMYTIIEKMNNSTKIIKI